MSFRTKDFSFASPVGVGTHYRHLVEYVNDKTRMDMLAECLGIAPRRVAKDSCDQWTIMGTNGFVQTAGDDTYVVFVCTYSSRKWGAIKRAARSFGWHVAQDGDDEGTLLLHLPDSEKAVGYLRSLLGLRKGRGPENSALKNGVSA